MNEQKTLTTEGYKKMEERLKYLKTIKRKEIAENIRTARSFGDLSENSEYDEAKNEQGMIEQEILELEETLKRTVVVDESELSLDTVSVGLKVKILDVEYDEELEYRIVGSSESDPEKGMISDESPVGRELIGKKVGETVSISTPGATMQFKILSITR